MVKLYIYFEDTHTITFKKLMLRLIMLGKNFNESKSNLIEHMDKLLK